MRRCFFITAALTLALASCKHGTTAESIPILRFDTIEAAYMQLPSSERDSIIINYAPEIGFLQGLYGQMSADSVMCVVSASRPIEVFAPDVRTRLSDLGPMSARLGELFSRCPDVLPGAKIPTRVTGIILPYRQSIVLADTLMLIGLNHYLGTDYDGYVSFDAYTRAQKSIERIPYHVAEAIVASSYPYKGKDGATTLSRLLYEGAVIESLTRLFPDVSPAYIMGYTPEQFQQLEQNEATLWKRIISRNMLYDVDPMTAARLIEPAASTAVISPDSPARAGRYLGWRIVKSYVDSHPQVSVERLLEPTFYCSDATLKASGYAPG